MDAKALGERIRDSRKRAEMSQENLGRAVGLERTVVNKIEAGVRKVTALELSDIADAIGVRMSTFFEAPVPALVAHRSSQGLDTADSQIDALLAVLAREVEFIASLGVVELGLDAADAVTEAGFTKPLTGGEAESLAGKARELMAVPATSRSVNSATAWPTWASWLSPGISAGTLPTPARFCCLGEQSL